MRRISDHRRLALLLCALACTNCGGGAPPPAGPPVPITAAFTFAPASPRVNESVQFTDATSGGSTSWSWTFGDGATSSSQNPTHVYATAGSFTVTLVSSNAVSSATATRSITVAPAVPLSSAINVVLGRPTDASVAASIRVASEMDVYLEYGTHPGTYTDQTVAVRAAAGAPAVIGVAGLQADTAYSYRARYRPTSEADYSADAEHAFHTRRRSGSSFTFVIQADPHLDENSSLAVYSRTLLNEAGDRPDFMIDLGDTSMAEKCAVSGTSLCATPSPATPSTVLARYELARSYFEQVCHSIPLFMVLGNHDGESGWTADPAASSLDAWSVLTRKAFFANPEPDRFYSGSSDQVPGIGLRENYYAFEWGDALFVVLDPYTYTTRKPGQDGWGWTLGSTQYQWLARTLSGSRARFKFVFSHHILGGNGSEARGGAAFAGLYEWGGRNADGTWAFDKQRPGWPAPIQQLLVENKVTAWFHGHDHFYAREEADGVVYQEVPQPSLARYDMPDPGAGYGYLGSIGTNMFASSGHLRVTVTATEVRVEYVRSVAAADETPTRRNGSIVHSYVMR